MNRNSDTYQSYLHILEKELMKAMGCTEPIAIAYCAAKAREVLGQVPDQVIIEVSGNIIKNVKSVIVPNTNGGKGIETAAAIGIVGGDPLKELQVISEVTDEEKRSMASFLQTSDIKVFPLENGQPLEILITVKKEMESASVHIVDDHTNIVNIKKDEQDVFSKEVLTDKGEVDPDYEYLNVDDIYEFATTCQLKDVEEILTMQISCNKKIAEEGLRGDYGANIGEVLFKAYGGDVKVRAKALAAAGSDARMNGCELPVVINSGSGNQGLTVSLPLIAYAEELKTSKEQLYRGLLISNLSAVHVKTEIGKLSAYCGAVSAGASAGAGIAYLLGGDLKVIKHTIVNALAITSGIICDGAKASCAAKIASAVDAGILGYEMYVNGQQFYGGDGIVSKGIENTIKNIGKLGSKGMYETDKEIIRIMTCVD